MRLLIDGSHRHYLSLWWLALANGNALLMASRHGNPREGPSLSAPSGVHGPDLAATRLVLALNEIEEPQRWRVFFRKLRCRSTWANALRMQSVVARNAVGSIACAWLANGSFALGNVFSGKASRHQSRSELVVANMAWSAISFCTVILAARLLPMLSLRFLEAPDRRPTAWFCLKKLMRGTALYFFATLAVMFAFSSLVARLSDIVAGLFKFKLECYVGTLSTHGFFTGATLTARQIYFQETCQGRGRLIKGQLKRRKLVKTGAQRRIAPAGIAPAPSTVSASSSPPSYRSPTFWRAYIKEFPKSAPAALAGAFVHVLSRQRIVERGAIALACFIICSIAFKLAIQEGTKHYILKKHVHCIRFMCAAVALPTVLIDTQTRIILLGTKNTRLVALGTLGMAFLEICLRVGKAELVMWRIRRRERLILTPIPSQPALTQLQEGAKFPPKAPSATRVAFELWRRQLQAFHTAEVNADMYAEYIAIGCSASLLLFFGNHPHYSLLRLSEGVEAEADAATRRVDQLCMLAFQVGVEVVVDYVSMVLEITAGIEFEHIKDLGSFLAALFVVATVLNVDISASIYLS
ncbi:hypothetical protein BBJ28_00017761 [Nothophytophthora sp. Chile5]|nr:hypothetical protein BBJ28_00017761 [Nothophytophthora sp. Chile5]